MNSDIYPWLIPNWVALTKQSETNRLPHAMAWITPPGIGTTELAQAFLQWLMCAVPETDRACGKCNHCQLFIAGTHPDYHHLTLQEKSKDIKIEQIRHLITKLMEKPYQGSKRLVLLEPADCLNRAAANAFLKTLEEPGDETFILLLTSRPEALSATIRSRCQTTHFHAPNTDVAVDFVQQQHPDDSDTVLRAVKLAQNCPFTALQLIVSGTLQARIDFFAYLTAMTNDKLDPVAVAGRYKQPEQVIEVCDWLYNLLSDCEKMFAGIEPELLSNADQQDLMTKLLKQPVEYRMLWLEKLNEYKRLMLKRTNVNPVLTMESLLTSWIAFCVN